MTRDALQQALRDVRRILIDLERHLDRAAEQADLTEAARAWVRAAQVEAILREVVPPEARETAKADELGAPASRPDVA